jgi:hypothetical protein
LDSAKIDSAFGEHAWNVPILRPLACLEVPALEETSTRAYDS